MLHALYHAAKDFLQGKPVHLRSSKWRSVRAAHLKVEDRCQYCGSKDYLEVHHIKPFHLQPELECKQYNLITLCEGPNRCHLIHGHLGNWKNFNPHIRAECSEQTQRKNAMKAPLKVLFLLPFLLCLGVFTGCTSRPDAVKKAAEERTSTFNNVAKTKSAISDFTLNKLRQAEYARIDDAVDRSTSADFVEVKRRAALPGAVATPEQMIEGTKKILDTRDAERKQLKAKVEADLASIKALSDQSDLDLAIANKIDEVVEKFDNASPDVKAVVQPLLDQVLALIAAKTQKSMATVQTPALSQ